MTRYLLRRLSHTVLVVVGMVVVFLPASFAANAPKEPDPNANPVLASIVKMGAKLFYLGPVAGLEGWFIVKDGQVQIAYSTADGQHALIGAMFGKDGQNISTEQINTLMTTNKEVSAMVTAAAGQAAGAFSPGQAPSQAVPILPRALDSGSGTANAAVANVPPALLPLGERLMRDLLNASGIVVGNSSAPLLLMIMDPNCPHCKATWRALRDAVF